MSVLHGHFKESKNVIRTYLTFLSLKGQTCTVEQPEVRKHCMKVSSFFSIMHFKTLLFIKPVPNYFYSKTSNLIASNHLQTLLEAQLEMVQKSLTFLLKQETVNTPQVPCNRLYAVPKVSRHCLLTNCFKTTVYSKAE